MSQTQSFLSGVPNMFSPSNPYPDYEKLRNDKPLYRLSPLKWIVTKYEDAITLLQDPMVSHWGQDSQTQDLLFGSRGEMSKTMFAFAPDTTSPYRKKVLHGLAAKNLKFEKSEMEQCAKKIIERICKNKRIDFMEDYAQPFTIESISRIIGIPSDKIQEWTLIVQQLKGEHYLQYIVDKNPRSEAGKNFVGFLKDFISYKKKNPDEDIASELILSSIREKESEDFAMSLIIFLFYAGHDNMKNFLGNSIVAIEQDGDVFNELKNEISDSSYIDELLRYDSPVQFFMLFTKDTVELRGTKIAAGNQILVSVGAANRDPAQFQDPNRIILSRNPRHLSYGFGAYRCIGARLAQLQASTGIDTFLKHLNSYSIINNGLEWNKNIMIQRGPTKLMLETNWV